MEEDTEKTVNNYELGFHLLPDLDEVELKSSMEYIESTLTKLGSNITSKKEIRSTRLSYPINHKRSSYFGTIDFEATPELIETLNQELKLQEKILRFIILKHKESERVLRSVIAAKRKPKMKVFPTAEKKSTKEDKEKQKEIEKQIEEVIEKI